MRTILLIMIGISSLMAVNPNGVVNDNKTNLEWQDDYSDNNNSIKNTTWQSAIDYCENLNLDGKSDWRLPNLNELTSLLDYTRYNPSIDSIFQNTDSDFYWSSTSNVLNNDNAWLVNFDYGYQTGSHKDYSYYVRCVRAGQ